MASMSDPERFDGDDGLSLGFVAELVGPDYRADLAELRAQVRYLADEYGVPGPYYDADVRLGALLERLRTLVGDWPHEVKP